MIKYLKLLLLVLFVITINESYSCTTAVISGRYTPDGKPMIWKHRDTWSVNNVIMHFTDGKYSYTGLVNSQDTLGKNIWIGVNINGFAIMNSASYNLNVGDTIIQSGEEGRVMKEALSSCGSLEDFEAYLNALEKPIKLEANYGVIDAFGGAAYYEIGNYGYEKIDANDPKIAPYGYVIRTNFSFTGEMGVGGGYIRYNTASDLFYTAASENSLTPKYIIQNVTRSLSHSLTKEDLIVEYGDFKEGNPRYVHFRDYISRTSSASSVVIQGVKDGQAKDMSVMWSVVGFPLTSVVIPVWVKSGNEFPNILKYNERIKDSPLCNAAIKLKEQCIPVKWGKSERYYLNVNLLHNSNSSGIMQIIKPLDDEIFEKGTIIISKSSGNNYNVKDIRKFNGWVDDEISRLYMNEFNLSLEL